VRQLRQNSEAFVAVGALAGTDEQQIEAGALAPGDFLYRAIKAGMKGFDAVTINAYGNTIDGIEGPSNQRTLASVLRDKKLNKELPGLQNLELQPILQKHPKIFKVMQSGKYSSLHPQKFVCPLGTSLHCKVGKVWAGNW
jgi:hypothetical protein